MENPHDGNGKYKPKVAVITGASSGIGRATAHEFARRGIIVVAASRNKKALEDVAEECKSHGSDAMAVVTDVTKEEEVKHLAKLAREKFGSLDIWVNNAAVTLFGRFEEVPTADIRQVVETNLFGYMYGARAAISHFREQGHGTLINVSSIVAVTGQPFSGAYVATKAAEKALSESLRQELMDEKKINVCTVMPAVTDTPIFQHGANYMGKEVIPPRPIHPPEKVAKIIADMARKPKKEVYAGSPGQNEPITRAFTPSGMYDKKIKKNIDRQHFRDNITEETPGNLYGYFMDQLNGGWLEEFNENGSSPNKWIQAGFVAAGIAMAFLAVWGYKKTHTNGKKAGKILFPAQTSIETVYTAE